MDGKFQTSFIPKNPMDGSERRERGGAGLFMTGSVFIFIVSLVLAGAVFAGQKYLASRLVKDKETFTEAQKKFDSVTVDYLVRLSKKIDLAKVMLGKRVVVSPLFDYLQANTYKTVRFKSMKLSFSGEKGIDVDMKGEAKNFDAVALQSDLFSENKDFKNPVISDIDRSSTGGVSFNFKTQVDPGLLLYKNTIDTQDTQ